MDKTDNKIPVKKLLEPFESMLNFGNLDFWNVSRKS